VACPYTTSSISPPLSIIICDKHITVYKILIMEYKLKTVIKPCFKSVKAWRIYNEN